MNTTGPKWVALAATVLLAGCTIDKMQSTNVQAEQRVRGKEGELQGVEVRQGELQSERQRLMSDLRSREMSIDEMSSRLQAIQQLNANTRAVTQEQQRQKSLREQQLNEAAGQVKALGKDTSSTKEEKAKRLEAVRQKLRTTLELLVVS